MSRVTVDTSQTNRLITSSFIMSAGGLAKGLPPVTNWGWLGCSTSQVHISDTTHQELSIYTCKIFACSSLVLMSLWLIFKGSKCVAIIIRTVIIYGDRSYYGLVSVLNYFSAVSQFYVLMLWWKHYAMLIQLIVARSVSFCLLLEYLLVLL